MSNDRYIVCRRCDCVIYTYPEFLRLPLDIQCLPDGYCPPCKQIMDEFFNVLDGRSSAAGWQDFVERVDATNTNANQERIAEEHWWRREERARELELKRMDLLESCGRS